MAYNPATAAALIRNLAPKYGIDPEAAYRVATAEGLSGRVGDNGTSFGPFQLHIGGALPKGIADPQGWSSSPAGISYALQRMAASGARGLTGANAVATIVRNFERPADPEGEIARALGSSSPVPSGASVGGPTSAGMTGSDPRISYVLGLSRANAVPQGPARTAALLQNLLAFRNNGGASQAPLPGGAAGPVASGLNPDFQSRLQAFEQATGTHTVSGFRSDAEQAKLFADAVRKYGSVAAARKWVAPPGASKHNQGLAVDLGGNLALAHKLAGKFGLYFPMSWEPRSSNRSASCQSTSNSTRISAWSGLKPKARNLSSR
jgi:hypothetical protein